jgi:mRNA interferase MazF
MEKDFDSWNQIKKELEVRKSPDFRVGDIWWCSIGVNLGHEEDGKNQDFERPVLIIRKFNKELFWAIPLTSKLKSGEYYHTVNLFGDSRTLIISQVRVLSSRRLLRKLHKISFKKLTEINNRLSLILKTASPIKAKPRMPNGSLYINDSKFSNKKQSEMLNDKLNMGEE